MLKGLLLSRAALWGAKVCLATDIQEGGDSPRVSSAEDGVWLGVEERNGEAAKMLGLSVLHECKNGAKGIRKCLLGFVRGRSLELRFAEVAKKSKAWEYELERLAETSSYNQSRKTSSLPKYVPTFSELNNYFKHAYDSYISNFKKALGELHGCMKSEDFFPDPEDSREKMAKHSADLRSLRKSIRWSRNDIAEHRLKYVYKASEVLVQAQKIMDDFMECMKDSPAWKCLTDQRKEGSADRQDINDFMLDYLTENDSERWEALIKSVEPVLGYWPLRNNGNTDSFDGFDDLVACIMEYAKERRIEGFWGSSMILFEMDLDFSRSLSRKMDLLLSRNRLSRGEARTPETDNGLYD